MNKTMFFERRRYDAKIEEDTYGYKISVRRAQSGRTSAFVAGNDAIFFTTKGSLADAAQKTEDLTREYDTRGAMPEPEPEPEPEPAAPKEIEVYASQYFGSGVVDIHWSQVGDDLEEHISARVWAKKNMRTSDNGFYRIGKVDELEFRSRWPRTQVAAGSCNGWDYDMPYLKGQAAPSLSRCRKALAAGETKVSQAWKY